MKPKVTKYPVQAIKNTIPKDYTKFLGVVSNTHFELMLNIVPDQTGKTVKGISLVSEYAFIEKSSQKTLAELHLKVAYELDPIYDEAERNNVIYELVEDGISDFNKIFSTIESPFVRNKQHVVPNKEFISQKIKQALGFGGRFN